MGLFGSKKEGGLLDVIRCDETDYLIWKWRPNGASGDTLKENAIRWGSSLRVKEGEVAVFVYKQENGPSQEFIEGPFDETLKTGNLPVLSNFIGMAYAGQSPFQAEVYFINLAGNIKVSFRVPYFDVFDPRFSDFPVRVAAGGSYTFNIQNYKAFIKLHRLISFELSQFTSGVRDAVTKYIKGAIVNAPMDHAMPVLQLERKLLELNELMTPRIRQAFEEDFGACLLRLDLSAIEVDKTTEEYRQLRQVTADLEIAMRQKQNEVSMKNIEDSQKINLDNMSETLRIQREQAERLATLQTQSQYLGAHQINQQTDVLKTAAENLGAMGQMNTGSGGGFNPSGIMTGMAVGGAMGGQMAGMMNAAGQNIQQASMMPPPLPQLAYFVTLNGQAAGPFNQQQLIDLVRTGQLGSATHVWKQGMAGWVAANTVDELSGVLAVVVPPPVPPPLPPQNI